MSVHTLLGANGTIATELVPILLADNQKVRLVSRNPKVVANAEAVRTDLLNRQDVFNAVKGSDIVYLLAGLEYNKKIWQNSWPKIMQHTIDACKASGASLVFFDNVYMYGRLTGEMTEETPVNPCSEKGKIRAEIDQLLQSEMRSGSLKALIARSADFYGPRATKTSVASIMIFDKMKKGKKSQWMVDANQLHSFTYTPDAALALYKLASTETAYGQVWHLPTAAPALTGIEFITIAAKYMNVKPAVQTLPAGLITLIGFFVPIMKELGEMLYQNRYPYVFNSSKFEKAFQFKPTTYEEGIKKTAEWFLAQPST